MDNQKILKLLSRNILNFIIFCIPIVFFQPFNDPFGPAQLMVAKLFIPLFLLLTLYLKNKSGNVIIKKAPFLIPMAIYLAVAFVSIFLSINKGISVKYFVELMIIVFGAYLIYSFSEKKDIVRIFVIIMVSHTLMSIYGITQHFNADIFKWNTNFAGRPMGTIGNPDFFAGELLIAIFVIAAYAVFGKKHKALAYIALAINLICLVYTRVAGAYLGFGVGLVYFVIILFYTKREALQLFIKTKKSAVIITLLILVVLLASAFPVGINKFKVLYKEKQRSLVHRLLMWEASVLMTKDSPLIGKGFGSYRLNYPYYQGILLNDTKNKKYDYVVTWMPHQQYLHIAAETGLLGIGAFLALIFVFYFIVWDVFIRKKRYPVLLIGISAAVTSVLAASFFNTFYNIASTMLFFFIMIFSVSMYSSSGKVIKLKAGAVKALIGLMGVILLYVIVSDGKLIAANGYLKKANKLTKDKYYKQAIAYHERVLSFNVTELTPQADVAQYYYAAESYREAGMFKKALENYEKDLAVNPYCPEVNNMYGAMSGQFGNIEKSIKHLNVAVFSAPHYETAYTNLTTAYMQTNDTVNARKTIENYIRLNGTTQRLDGMLKAIDKVEGK